MTHMPTTTSVNAWCPNCGLEFLLAEKDNQVACPGCGTIQIPPIIMTGKDEFVCLGCQVTFSNTPPSIPRCHECLKEQVLPTK